MTIDPYHLAALAGGIVIGASIVYAAGLPKHTDRVDPVDILAECRREDGTYPPPPSGGSGQATARDTEVPPRVHHPLALPAPRTGERLRLWTHDFEFIEELPLNARRRDEGLIRLLIGSSAERRLDAAFRNDELVWLTVDGSRGQWIGWCIRVHWDSKRSASRDFEFRPAPDWATVWVGWSA